jgi:hypothetical protein
VTAIYTGRSLEEQVLAAAAEILPGVTFTSILDSSVILDINADGRVTRHCAADAAVLRERGGQLGQDVDVVVLAQASMARMRDRLAESASLPVLTSLRSGLRAVGAELARQRAA